MSVSSVNRVPVEPIAKIIQEYLAMQVDLSGPERDHRYPAPFVLLAEKLDIDADSLRSYIRTDRAEAATMSFDLADRLLCVMHRSDLWRGRLLDVYEAVVLVDDFPDRIPARVVKAVCAAPLCANEFTKTNRRTYCSQKCKERARNHRAGLKGRYGTADKCPNGHEWTTENTRVDSKTNKRYCRRCAADAAKRIRDKETPAQRDKRIQYSRDYYAASKAA